MKIQNLIPKSKFCRACLTTTALYAALTSTAIAQPDNIVIGPGMDGMVIDNPVGSSITATQNAIRTQSDTTINNAGTISGGFNGVNFENGSGSGSLTNSVTGIIQSDSRAVNIGGTVVLDNLGQILGTGDQRNATVYSDSVANNFSITNSGTIDAGAGNQGAGIGLEIDTLTTATISNSGIIQGRTNTPGVAGNSPASADGIRLGNFGPAAPRVFDGTISNAATGLINSESQSGPIAGFRSANGIGFQGTLDNAGEISGVANGVYFGTGDHTGGVVNNAAGGTISSDSRALNIDGDGLTVNNDGSITGTGNQRNGTIYADATAQNFTINNSGTVDTGVGNEGAGFSAELADTGNSFTINNSGTLQGRGSAAAGATAAGDGIRLERTRNGGVLDGTTTGLFTGQIDNSGTLVSESTNGTTGGFRAVNGVDFQGTLDNSGTISGAQNGVYFGTGNHTGGVVNNAAAGTISSDSRAVNIDGDGLTVNNDGAILATGRQRNGTVYVDGTSNNYTVNNSGNIDATGGAGSGVSVQVGVNDGDARSGSITNSGTITGSGDQAVDAGVRFFTNASSAVFNGDILNASGGVVSGGENSAAVLFDDETSFGGTLTNEGTLDGSVFLNDGDLLLTDTSILSLEISSLTDFEEIVTTGDITFDGILDISFADGFLPATGNTIDLFDFSNASGAFDEIRAGGVVFDTSDIGFGGSITIAAVPEPSSVIVIGLGSLALLARRRRS